MTRACCASRRSSRFPLIAAVACMSEEVCAVFWLEGLQSVSCCGLEGFDGSCGGFSNVGLELGEGILDGIANGTVGRQVEQRCAAGFDSLPDASYLVGGQIVHDDKVTWPQSRREHLLAPSSAGVH